MKRLFYISFCILFLMKGSDSIGSDGKTMSECRTYMSYTWPIDPAKLIVTPDQDLSYALASTLVEWSHSKQIASGLASRWTIKDHTSYVLTLQPGVKWSDGTPITSEDIKKSLERGQKVYPDDWRSLTNIVKSISCPSPNTIEFKLNMPAEDSNLLGKLTEPNYGIVKVTSTDGVNASVTTGPFYLAAGSKSELELRPNPNWIRDPNILMKKIVIRRLAIGASPQEVLLKDQWANLMQVSLLLPKTISDKYQKSKFNFWNRPTDRVFLFQLGRRLYNEEGQKLFKFLNTHVDRESLLEGLVAGTTTKQLFPSSYRLYDRNFNAALESKAALPEPFTGQPLEILISPERVSPTLRENIAREVLRLTGQVPHFIEIPMSQLFSQYWKNDYDFYAGTYGLADPNPEGLMSFYFENDFRIIPEINEPYLKRLDAARRISNEEKRFDAMRDIMTDATYKGHIVPLFHSSTMGIAREEIDLSQVPLTDETVTLSKLRYRGTSH
jgi:ABC-type transport system substrate-binding protein